LALLYADPDRGHTISELSNALSAHVATVQREVARLEEAGILESARVGKSRVVRPNLRSPYAEDLGSLVIKAFGPARVLGPLLSKIPGVEEAFVFGSWADRHAGVRGPAPAVDVLVIGRPDAEALDGVALRAEAQLGREVNITIRSREAWRRKADGFLQSVRAGNLIPIELEAR